MSYVSSSSSRSLSLDGPRYEVDGDPPEFKMCYCGHRIGRQTSWTRKHHGLRFWSCPDRVCGYFEWKDPMHSAWSKRVITYLMEANAKGSWIERGANIPSVDTAVSEGGLAESDDNFAKVVDMYVDITAKLDRLISLFSVIRTGVVAIVCLLCGLFLLWVI